MPFSVHAYPKKGVKNQKFLNEQVRRTADLLGHSGIIAKRGQFDTVIAKQGFLCTVWPTRQLAKKFQALVKKRWGTSIETRRFRRRTR